VGKGYILEVKGTVHSLLVEGAVPEVVAREVVADMLRYDVGDIQGDVVITAAILPGGKEIQGFKRYCMTVISKHYTQARWRSFGIHTEIIGRTS